MCVRPAEPFEASELLSAITRLEDRIVAQPSPGRGAAVDNRMDEPPDFSVEEKEKRGTGKKSRQERRSGISVGGRPKLTRAKRSPRRLRRRNRIPVWFRIFRLTSHRKNWTHSAHWLRSWMGRTPAAEDAAPPAKQECEPAEPVVDPAAAAGEAASVAEPPAFAVEGKNEFEIPVEAVEPTVEGAASVAAPAAVEVPQPDHGHPETQHPETEIPKRWLRLSL